jgi:hypothetical protein
MPIKVNVRAFLDKDGTVLFDHDWDNGGGPLKYGTIDVPKKEQPMFEFHFKDDTKLNLSFYGTPKDAIWVVPAELGCPQGPGDAGQLDLNDPPSSSSPKLLKVLDKNPDDALFTYALRFDGDPYKDSKGDHPPYVYDPDFKNGGGGSGLLTVVAVAIGGALVGTVVSLVAAPTATPVNMVAFAVGGAALALGLVLALGGFRQRAA